MRRRDNHCIKGDRVMIKDFIWMLPRAVCVVVVVHYFVEGVKLL